MYKHPRSTLLKPSQEQLLEHTISPGAPLYKCIDYLHDTNADINILEFENRPNVFILGDVIRMIILPL